jgi:hypothetical protein
MRPGCARFASDGKRSQRQAHSTKVDMRALKLFAANAATQRRDQRANLGRLYARSLVARVR